jgi:TetR/AcrR family transcriptional repressor of nem operon
MTFIRTIVLLSSFYDKNKECKMTLRDQLIETALACFWEHGYSATSMAILAKQPGLSRQNVYSEFGGKHSLFLACMQFYQKHIVSPAIADVEDRDLGIAAIESYFEAQIQLGVKKGLPGPGCFMVNTSTEIGPHDEMVQAQVIAHFKRLVDGFKNALAVEAGIVNVKIKTDEIDSIARLLVSFSQGLWGLSRSIGEADVLRDLVNTQMLLVRSKF